MRITMRQGAPDGGVFAPTAFDSQIGKDVPVRVEGRTLPGRLVDADVADDGRDVLLTFDVDVLARCNCDGEWWGGEHVSACPLGPTEPRR